MATPPAKKKTANPPAKKVEVKTETKTETPVVKSDFKIQKNVPIPPRAGGRSGSKYPFRKMEVGDSVFVEGKATKVASAIQAASKANKGWKFESRAINENGASGVRVWRTEDKKA